MKKMLLILLLLVGCVAFFYGLVVWYDDGFPLAGLWFYKSTFMTHALHMSILGLIMVAYAVERLYKIAKK